MHIYILLFALFHVSLAAIRTSPPPGSIVVAKSGERFSTIQDAVNSLSTAFNATQVIFIQPGTYNEQVYIPAQNGPLTILGYTHDTLNYQNNTVTITHNLSQASTGRNNDGTATVRAWASNFEMYNINMVNTYGKGSQAVALSAQATNQSYYACQFRGYQDTLLAQKGNQLYAKCLIEGVTDFIFGDNSQAWFERCDIRVLSANLGYITANGRSDSKSFGGYAFNQCTVRAAKGNVVPDGAYFLGRPWRNYSSVIFQFSDLSAVINPAGWREWNVGDPRTDHVNYQEYRNTGDGAKGVRANFSKQAENPVKFGTYFNDRSNPFGNFSVVDWTYMGVMGRK